MHEFYSSPVFEERFTYTGNDLGAVWSREKTCFRLWAPTASCVSIKLYKTGNPENEDLLEVIPTIRPDRLGLSGFCARMPCGTSAGHPDRFFLRCHEQVAVSSSSSPAVLRPVSSPSASAWKKGLRKRSLPRSFTFPELLFQNGSQAEDIRI